MYLALPYLTLPYFHGMDAAARCVLGAGLALHFAMCRGRTGNRSKREVMLASGLLLDDVGQSGA